MKMIDSVTINRSYCIGVGDVQYDVQIEYIEKKPLSQDDWI